MQGHALAQRAELALAHLDKPISSKASQQPVAGVSVSVNARTLMDWVLRVGDHQGLPFVVVDKVQARVFVFDRAGHFQGASAALLGLARGDQGIPGLGDRPLSKILPSERTTPAGRFAAAWDHNISGQEIIWVDYEQGISMHPVRSVNPQERRLARLASPTANDNRISYGCINLPTVFWRQVISPLFRGKKGVVYVLPEDLPMQVVFPMAKTP